MSDKSNKMQFIESTLIADGIDILVSYGEKQEDAKQAMTWFGTVFVKELQRGNRFDDRVYLSNLVGFVLVNFCKNPNMINAFDPIVQISEYVIDNLDNLLNS